MILRLPGRTPSALWSGGSVSLIRIDEEGVATVLEEMGPGGVFGRHLAFAGFCGGQPGGGGPHCLRHSVYRLFLHISTAARMPAPTTARLVLEYAEPAQQ